MAVFRNRSSAGRDPSLRHVWLASLGLLVAARRQTYVATRRLADDAQQAARRVRAATGRACADVRGSLAGVRNDMQPKVVHFSAGIEARLAPVLAKLGLPTSSGRQPPAARKPAARRSARTSTRRVQAPATP